MKFKAISCIISILLGFTGLGLGANVDKYIGLTDKNSTVNEAQISKDKQEIKDSNNVEVPLNENVLPLNNDAITESGTQTAENVSAECPTGTPQIGSNENSTQPEKDVATGNGTETSGAGGTTNTTQTPTKATPPATTAPAATTNTSTTGTTAAQGDYLAKVEDEIFTATNNERVKAGLQPLKRNSTANGYARSKSLEMLNLNYFDHKSPTNGYISDIAKRDGWKYSRIGENIYTMTGSSASSASGTAINNSWMSSPGHKANILNKDYTDIGIGVTYRNNKLYATQTFYTS